MYRRRFAAALAAFMSITLCCSAVAASSWTMADGSVHFHTPSDWTRIMNSPGEPQVMAFKVPDPSPTGKVILARVVVTAIKAPDVATFKAFISKAHERAATQPDVKIDKQHSSDTLLRYSTREGKMRQVVDEHFVLDGDHAIEVSCTRPAHSRAGAHWEHAFDAGCRSVVEQIQP